MGKSRLLWPATASPGRWKLGRGLQAKILPELLIERPQDVGLSQTDGISVLATISSGQ
jgi:hypothetical protein